DEHVAQEPRMPDALDRRTGEHAAESRIVELHHIGERRRLELGAGAQLHLVRFGGELVPGADRETVVAAIDAVAHGRAEFMRDRPLVLDVEIAEAAPRIQTERGREGVRRADVETLAAAAAALL